MLSGMFSSTVTALGAMNSDTGASSRFVSSAWIRSSMLMMPYRRLFSTTGTPDTRLACIRALRSRMVAERGMTTRSLAITSRTRSL